jgi:hypothetical protein
VRSLVITPHSWLNDPSNILPPRDSLSSFSLAGLLLGSDELPIRATTISDHVRVVMKVGGRGVLGSIMVLASGLTAGAVQTVGNVGLFLWSKLSEKRRQ